MNLKYFADQTSLLLSLSLSPSHSTSTHTSSLSLSSHVSAHSIYTQTLNLHSPHTQILSHLCFILLSLEEQNERIHWLGSLFKTKQELISHAHSFEILSGKEMMNIRLEFDYFRNHDKMLTIDPFSSQCYKTVFLEEISIPPLAETTRIGHLQINWQFKRVLVHKIAMLHIFLQI